MPKGRKALLPPVLITSSINVDAKFTLLTNPKERLRYTIEAIKEWLLIDRNVRLVICDGSGFDLSDTLTTVFPQADIECLTFKNNSKLVFQYGKGWGEGEIIKFALQESSTLAKSDHLVKCTSKLFVSNIDKFVSNKMPDILMDGHFKIERKSLALKLERIDTRFYIIKKAVYMRIFLDAHWQVRDDEGHFLEHCFRDVIIGRNITGFVPHIRPSIEGMSGSSFLKYNTKTYRLRDRIKRFYLSKSTNLLC